MELLLENVSPEDMKKYLKEYYNYAANELGLKRKPKLILKDDQSNADDLLGKTGYYDPDREEIYLFITDRHAKDIIRSFAHELIHHHQNLSGMNDNLDLSKTANDPAYASHDPQLREMERDAFERGNMMFRDWCDSKKMERKQTMSEVKINKKASDLDNDGKLSGYEKKRGMAIAKSMSGQVDEVDIPKSKESQFKAEREKFVKGMKGEVPKKSIYPIAANKAKQKMGLEEDDTYGDAEAKGAPTMNEEDKVVEAIYNKVMEKLRLQEAPREDDEPMDLGDDDGSELNFDSEDNLPMNKGKVKKAGLSDFGDDEAPEASDDMEEIPTGDEEETPAVGKSDPMAQMRAEKMMQAIKDFLNNARESLQDGDNEEAVHNFLEGRKATARLVKYLKANPGLKLKHKGRNVDLSKLKERKWKKKKMMKENKEVVSQQPEVPYPQLFETKQRLMNDRFNAHENLVYQELMNKFIKKE